MTDYRLYIFRRGHIATFRAFQAEDDAVAAETGRRLAAGEEAELWSGERRVRDYRAASV